MDEVDYTGSGLRKRTGKRSPDRSVSPTQRALNTEKTTSPLRDFQTTLQSSFPEVYFTDEFYDNEEGTSMCMVGGLTCSLGDIVPYNRAPFEFKLEDGRLSLTHTPGQSTNTLEKNGWCCVRKISKSFLLISFIWIITIILVVSFILTFHEKYNELYSSYNI